MNFNPPPSHALLLSLRALQLLFAIVVIGVVSYGIHIYAAFTVYQHSFYGDFSTTSGVPSAWGFLLFCALWTILTVIFAFFHCGSQVWLSWVAIGSEAVALLSWFAGWIAVAASVGSDICAAGSKNGGCCGSMTAATAFGALEWVLFAVTAFFTVKMERGRRRHTCVLRPGEIGVLDRPQERLVESGSYGGSMGVQVPPPAYEKTALGSV